MKRARPGNFLNAPAWTIEACSVMRILKESQGAKSVGFNLADNTIRVVRGEQRIAREIDDLLQAIKNDPGRSESADP